MKRKYYQRTDVQIFKEILKDNYFSEIKNLSHKKVQQTIQKLYRTEILISGLNINVQNEISKINLTEFGFKERKDAKIEFSPVVFDNKYKLIITPQTIYKLEDEIELPSPVSSSNKLFLEFISDTFERLKIKAENVIAQTEEETHIELYAKKNIQMLKRIYYDSRNKINKICRKDKKTELFKIFVMNIFIYNAILYYQNMFSSFYNKDIKTKQCLKMELIDSIGIYRLIEPVAETGKLTGEDKPGENEVGPITWNGQINTLATLLYDLMNKKLSNEKKMLEANVNDIIYLINKYVRDKNGNSISKLTIETCLKDYHPDKRAKGSKRINISKYTDMES